MSKYVSSVGMRPVKSGNKSMMVPFGDTALSWSLISILSCWGLVEPEPIDECHSGGHDIYTVLKAVKSAGGSGMVKRTFEVSAALDIYL